MLSGGYLLATPHRVLAGRPQGACPCTRGKNSGCMSMIARRGVGSRAASARVESELLGPVPSPRPQDVRPRAESERHELEREP